MRNIALSTRYAKALYELARESNEHEVVFEQMRELTEALAADPAITDFLYSPLIPVAEKSKALEAVLAKVKVSEVLKKFVLLLAHKNRLPILEGVFAAYQVISDEAHGVTRGVVRSAAVLGPDDRKRIEEMVGRATKKQVILTYKEDEHLLGGLVAQVGSYTFDDSLTSHLKRINEQLTRSAQ